MELEM